MIGLASSLTNLTQENVLIGDSGNVLLADVGLNDFIESLPIPVRTYGKVDDVRRTAPEVLNGGNRTTDSDVYSLGCLAFG